MMELMAENYTQINVGRQSTWSFISLPAVVLLISISTALLHTDMHSTRSMGLRSPQWRSEPSHTLCTHLHANN